MAITLNGTTGITAPAATLTTPLAQASGGTNIGTWPCFSAYASTVTSLVQNVATKVAFQTKEFDTTTAYDNITNMRFTPLVAGYYLVNGACQVATTATTMDLILYKNGTAYKSGGSSTSSYRAEVTALVYLNGTTDYIEIFCTQGAVTQNNVVGVNLTYFQAALIRGA